MKKEEREGREGGNFLILPLSSAHSRIRERKMGRGAHENSPLRVHDPDREGGEGTPKRRKIREGKWRKMGIEKEKRGRVRKGG